VASGVGGLLTLVDHGETGFLVPDRSPARFAEHVADILDHPDRAAAMGRRAAQRAQRYTWAFAAARLRRVYADLAARDLVACA
jgi:D-inositol-3-phosphate glycosyltransferase